MPNMMDYIDWRGDLTYENDPINEVDCLLYAWISYVEFEGILPTGFDKAITLKECADIILAKYDVNQYIKESLSFTKNSILALLKATEKARYADCKIFGFRNEIDFENDSQFSAIVIQADPRTNIVVFRGTDDTIVGWKEDFNMSFMTEVPAQKKALLYLKEVAANTKGKLYICGHSKGGNLAVYSACRASGSIRKRIQKVYNYDGPGFGDQMVLGDHKEEVFELVESYVPEESIVGMLLNHANNAKVVKSDEKAINQHNAGSWQILGKHFITTEETVATSRIFDEAVMNWIRGISEEERKEFIDALFKVLGAGDAKTTVDINTDIMKSFTNMAKEYAYLSKDSKAMLKRIIGALIKEGTESALKKRPLAFVKLTMGVQEKVNSMIQSRTTEKENEPALLEDNSNN